MKIRKALPAGGATLLFLLSLGLVLYPLVSNHLAETHQSQILAVYTDRIEHVDAGELAAEWEAAREYNRTLSAGTVTMDGVGAAIPEAAMNWYQKLLNVNGNGLMGFVEIPKIQVYLPVYHGTDSGALEKGIGHIPGSSLPVGGASTHAVISGHSAMPGQRMLTDLDRLEGGDVFYMHILGETLAYQVDQITTVQPEDTSALAVVPEKDFLTLITCTPYGVNTHRLLVRGVRIGYEAAQEMAEQMSEAAVPSTWWAQYLRGILAGLGILPIILIMRVIFRTVRRHRRRGRHA